MCDNIDNIDNKTIFILTKYLLNIYFYLGASYARYTKILVLLGSINKT